MNLSSTCGDVHYESVTKVLFYPNLKEVYGAKTIFGKLISTKML